MNACYSINRKAGYVTIYNNNAKYPLLMWNELRTQHDWTHQETANIMLNYARKEEKS